MQRIASLVVGLLIAAGLVMTMIWTGHPRPRPEHPASSTSAGSAQVKPGPALPVPSGSVAIQLPEPEDPLSLTEPTEDWLSDGGKSLPNGAPSMVGFGVILFTYQGAQLAPANARSKPEALEKAKAVIEDAKKDFTEAVKKGDHGSTADLGHIPRGVLEPDVENVVFGLEKGAVYAEPIDTPRGYWVVRRTD